MRARLVSYLRLHLLTALWGWLVIGLLLNPGCAGPSVQLDPDPIDALQTWALALEEGRPRDAWRLLAPEAREGLSEDEFADHYARQRDDLIERARRILTWARAHPALERAQVTVGQRRFQLVRTRAGWRITGSRTTEGD